MRREGKGKKESYEERICEVLGFGINHREWQGWRVFF